MKCKHFFFTILLMVLPGLLFSMGLGEIRINSFLNQPFDAEIPLLGVGGVPLSSIRAGVAPLEEFEKIDLELNDTLSFLKFKVIRKRGVPLIHITSTERITEPYLILLVDLAWPNGQLYRKYTVLLDPPSYDLTKAGKSRGHFNIQQSSTEYAVKKQAVEPPVYVPVREILNGRSVKQTDATYGPTLANENIRQIAQRYAKGDSTVSQVVLAIVGTNSQAFTQGNLNGLKTGIVLRIPTMDEILSVPAGLAKAEAEAHDTAWKSHQSIVHVLLPPYIHSGNNQAVTLLPNQTALPEKQQVADAAPAEQQTDQSDITKVPQPEPTTFSPPEVTAAVPAKISFSEDPAIQMSYLPSVPAMVTTMKAVQAQNLQALPKVPVQKPAAVIQAPQESKPGKEVKENLFSGFWFYLLGILVVLAGAFHLYRQRQRHNEALTDEYPEAEALRPAEKPSPAEFITPVVPEPAAEIIQEPSPEKTTDLLKQEAPSVPPSAPPLPQASKSETEPHSGTVPKSVPDPENQVLPADDLPEKEIPEDDANYLVDFESGLDRFISPYAPDESNEAPAETGEDVSLPSKEPAPRLVKSKSALSTLLALAKTYISMEDYEAARHSLEEILEFGDKKQKQEASQLLDEIKDKK